MNRGSQWKLICAVAIGALCVTVAMQTSNVKVVPKPPVGEPATLELPASTSHLSIAISFPKSAIATQLENGIPKTFHFDSTSDGFHIYGTPGRGPIAVVTEIPASRVSASTPVSGRIQVEKKVLLLNASVGIDVSGGISASLAPEIATNWVINPHVDLSAHVDRAVAKTVVGDIDITGLVRGPVADAVNRAKMDVEAKVREALNVQKEVDRLWNEMNTVHKLSENPPTWVRITPQKATFGGFHYTDDSIKTGLALDLETHVFLQDAAPDVLKSPLSELLISGAISDDFTLSIPIELSYSVINQQLKTLTTKNPINLPPDASVSIADASIMSFGDGILLTVEFSGKKGWFKSASGRLYIVGVPVFDGPKAELRVDKLEFTAETNSIVVKTVDWLAHPKLLEAIKDVAVIKLDGELTKAKTNANDELEKLNAKLPKEVSGNVLVSEISIDRLAFAKDRAFVVVTAKGKMSAILKP